MRRHIPNTITCCNLLSGCIAAMYAFEKAYTLAFAFIIAGAVFDFFDGLTARALKVSSPIGKARNLINILLRNIESLHHKRVRFGTHLPCG